MQKLFNTCLLAVLLTGCGKKEKVEEATPPNILSDSTFTKLLTDFAMAESAANMNIKGAPGPTLDSVYAFNPLIENDVRKSQYDSTIKYYTAHPDRYKKVYENVMVRLTEIQSGKTTKVDSSSK